MSMFRLHQFIAIIVTVGLVVVAIRELLRGNFANGLALIALADIYSMVMVFFLGGELGGNYD